MKIVRIVAVILICSWISTEASAQSKYQSLMWKISGNGLTKPSYLYGTMHISGKMVFHLGEPFYDAVENSDVIALELEPEAWLKSIFKDPEFRSYTQRDAPNQDMDMFYSFDDDSPLPPLKGFFKLGSGFQDRLKSAIQSDPALLNYLMFRYGTNGYAADFEEDTWLDMYIYQTGKKLGKETLGLETYEQSDFFITQARNAEENRTEKREYDDDDIRELMDLQNQLEPAYRRQDLDLIDSLNRKTTSPGFFKYILVERNKIFVQSIDSVLKSGKSIFAAMGCAHLPGEQGIIEALRNRGYTVESYNKGDRNAKRREKLEKLTFPGEYKNYTSSDEKITFSTPSDVFQMGADNYSCNWISLDIANGASFTVTRMKTYAGLFHRDQQNISESVDSILYETIPGDILSIKKAEVNGNPAFDILNRSRRGDFQRKLIIILPEEIILMKVSATGNRVKEGYGNAFFNSIQVAGFDDHKNALWTSPDGFVSLKVKGEPICYVQEKQPGIPRDFEMVSSDRNDHHYFGMQRHVIDDPEFLDEDSYELNRLADAYLQDNNLKEKNRSLSDAKGLPAMELESINPSGQIVYAKLIIENLAYYAITALTEDSVEAKNYFKSVILIKDNHSAFFPYSDTVCFFKVDLPYTPDPSRTDNSNSWENKEAGRLYFGHSDQCEFSPPGESSSVLVEFQRYHKFSDGDDTLKFYQDREAAATRFGLSLEKKDITWNSEGCQVNFLLSDTGCTRKYLKKVILHNKTLYTITSSYDSVLGPGDFITRFYKSFEPTDSVFATYHFINRDIDFLNALTSSDSTVRSNAINLVGEMDFSPASGESIRNILLNFPQIPDQRDKELVREKLTGGLASDTSAKNILFITNEFYKYSDSAEYQLELLKVLLRMKTGNAWMKYKELLLDEPPILGEGEAFTGFPLLNDSLEISARMIPDLMALISLDEYRDDVYHLMAEALDSSKIKSSIYQSRVNEITFEARNELKRLNAKNDDSYSFSTENLLDYCTLLQPYRKQTDVQAFFDKSRKTKKMTLLLDLIDFDLKHKNPIPDSLFERVGSAEKQIIPLYRVLRDNQAKYQIPEKYRSREALLKLFLADRYSGNGLKNDKIDSIQVVSHRVSSIHQKDVDVYYCKFRKVKSKQWIGVVMIFDGSNHDNLWPQFIDPGRTIVIDSDEDELKELEEEYKSIVEQNRKFLNLSYGESRMNLQWY